MLDEEQQRWLWGIMDREFHFSKGNPWPLFCQGHGKVVGRSRTVLGRRIGVKSSLPHSWVGKLPGQGEFLGENCDQGAFLGVLSGHIPGFPCPKPPAFEQFLVFLIICHPFFQSSVHIPSFDVSQGPIPVSGCFLDVAVGCVGWVGCENPSQVGSWSRNFHALSVIPTFILAASTQSEHFAHQDTTIPFWNAEFTNILCTQTSQNNPERDTSKRDLVKISPPK